MSTRSDNIRKKFEASLKNTKNDTKRQKLYKQSFKSGAGVNNKYIAYEQAKAFLQMNGLLLISAKEYRTWRRVKDYKFLPLQPEFVYREVWEGWPVFLGKIPKRRPKMPKLPYLEARSIAHRLTTKYPHIIDGDIRNNWLKFYDEQYLLPDEEQEIPKNFPRNPIGIYKKEFTGWPDFFGKGIYSKIEHAQKLKEIQAEETDANMDKYQGQPVFAITTGIDPMNTNLIKVVVSNQGLSTLVATCNSLQYDIIRVYIFDNNQLSIILDDLTTYGHDKGDSCYQIHNMNGLLSALAFDAVELPRKLY